MAGASFHTVAMNAGVLLVECRECSRRAALTKQDGLPIYQGNMDSVAEGLKKLKCTRCKGKEVRAYIPINMEEAEMWLAGDPLPTARRII
jgi:hypothetical protein